MNTPVSRADQTSGFKSCRDKLQREKLGKEQPVLLKGKGLSNSVIQDLKKLNMDFNETLLKTARMNVRI